MIESDDDLIEEEEDESSDEEMRTGIYFFKLKNVLDCYIYARSSRYM